MNVLLLLPIVYLAAVLDTSLVDVMRIGPVVPDLLALTAVAWLLTARGTWALPTAGAIALLSDLIAPGRIGLGMGWMLIVGYGVLRLRMQLKMEHTLWRVALTWAAVTLWALAVGCTARLLGDVTLPWATILQRGLGVGLYTAGVSLPIWMIVGWTAQPWRIRRERMTQA